MVPLRMPLPYAQYLGTQDAQAVLAASPGLLQKALAALTPEQIAQPIAPGKWCPREIVAHLADCELAYGFRIRQILAAPDREPAVLQPFDQDVWALHYAAYDAPAALALFHAARSWNLMLVGSLSSADLARRSHHPERGDMTVQDVLQLLAGHDLNHLKQLQLLGAS